MADEHAAIDVVEFFSGVGGMRLALQRAAEGARVRVRSVLAYEISPLAIDTYRHNFRSGEVRKKLIEQVRVPDILNADGSAKLMWTLSPPCQPFTRTAGSKRLDEADRRNKGFFHLMSLLHAMRPHERPRWILFENVKGFIGSAVLQQWLETLRNTGYTWRAYLLSPMQFGIPNNRTRFYLCAELGPRFSDEDCASVYTSVLCRQPSKRVLAIDGSDLAISEDIESRLLVASQTECSVKRCLGWYAAQADGVCVRPLKEFLEAEQSPRERSETVLSREVLGRPFMAGMSVVGPECRTSYCITSAYARTLHRSSGSLVLESATKELAASPLDRSDMTVYEGSLRFFSRRELLRLMGFPEWFSFPPHYDLRTCCRLIGNSLNVTVVAHVCGVLWGMPFTPSHE